MPPRSATRSESAGISERIGTAERTAVAEQRVSSISAHEAAKAQTPSVATEDAPLVHSAEFRGLRDSSRRRTVPVSVTFAVGAAVGIAAGALSWLLIRLIFSNLL